jgi:hypothetical protein
MGVLSCGKRLDLILVTTVEIGIGIGGVYKNFWQTFLTFYVLRSSIGVYALCSCAVGAMEHADVSGKFFLGTTS